MRPDRAGEQERGSGSVLVLALLLIAVSGLLAAVWLAAALNEQIRLRAAADLAALAAAERGYLRPLQPGPCPQDLRDQAGRMAAGNGAELSGCVVDADLAVIVTVTPQGTPVRGSPGRAQARAGMPGPGFDTG